MEPKWLWDVSCDLCSVLCALCACVLYVPCTPCERTMRHVYCVVYSSVLNCVYVGAVCAPLCAFYVLQCSCLHIVWGSVVCGAVLLLLLLLLLLMVCCCC